MRLLNAPTWSGAARGAQTQSDVARLRHCFVSLVVSQYIDLFSKRGYGDVEIFKN